MNITEMDQSKKDIEFPDNLSIDSNDTEFLLSRNVDTVAENNYNVPKDYLNAIDKYNYTKNYLNSLNDDDNETLLLTTDDTNLSFIHRLTTEYEMNLDVLDKIKQHDEDVKDEPERITIPSMKDEKENFDKLDEKVREGQDIINRLLADMTNKRAPETSLKFTPIKGQACSPFAVSVATTDAFQHSDVESNPSTVERYQNNIFNSPPNQLLQSSFLGLENSLAEKSTCMQNEIMILKDQIINLEMTKNKELMSVSERSGCQIESLQRSIDSLQKQKSNLFEHVNQLKESLTKKNDKCLQFQEMLQEKTQQINKLVDSENEERHALQNEIKNLQTKKSLMDKQVNEMEKALYRQLGQIKELESQFKREKQTYKESMEDRDNLVENTRAENEKLKQEIFELKQKIHRSELEEPYKCEDLKRKISSLENQLFIEVQKNKELQQDVRNIDDVHKNLQNVRRLLKETQTHYKTLALELIEESTKLAVIRGTTLMTEQIVLSPGRGKIEEDAISGRDILSDALKTLKNHLDDFRNYTISLQQNQSQLLSTSSDDLNLSSTTTSSPSSSNNTANKLLRHLQSRVQQLRKENVALKEQIKQRDSQAVEVTDTSKFSERIELLESFVQEQNMKFKQQKGLLEEKNLKIYALQQALKQTTKENLELQKYIADINKKKMKTATNGHSRRHSGIKQVSFGTHIKALGPNYSGTPLEKFCVDKSLVAWSVPYLKYTPVEYTADVVLHHPPWADPDLSDEVHLRFNQTDGTVNRKSYLGKYVVLNGRPRNPIGRTGMTGRGLLGKWGPNHAVDPAVTCWLRDSNGYVMKKDGRPVLQFVAIQRSDTQEWALPGGMVDAGESLSVALKREFSEEALNSLQITNADIVREEIDKVFMNGVEIFKGYVDDPRNTDNAWMETCVVNFHDKNGDSLSQIPLTAGDDACRAKWLSIDRPLELYASHVDFIRKVCQYHEAYFPES